MDINDKLTSKWKKLIKGYMGFKEDFNTFDIKKKEYNEELIDPHTLMFVAIHELAHVASLSYSHTEEFWVTFKYLLTKADECNIHKSVNYHSQNIEYCGMMIKDNPYFL
jgi:hypothetical protein